MDIDHSHHVVAVPSWATDGRKPVRLGGGREMTFKNKKKESSTEIICKLPYSAVVSFSFSDGY